MKFQVTNISFVSVLLMLNKFAFLVCKIHRHLFLGHLSFLEFLGKFDIPVLRKHCTRTAIKDFLINFCQIVFPYLSSCLVLEIKGLSLLKTGNAKGLMLSYRTRDAWSRWD